MFPKDTNTMKTKKKHGTGPITEATNGKPLQMCTILGTDEPPRGEAAPLMCANKRIKSGHAISPKDPVTNAQ